jgi:hypothetical protein
LPSDRRTAAVDQAAEHYPSLYLQWVYRGIETDGRGTKSFNPYTPDAGARPPARVGRDRELDHLQSIITQLTAGGTERHLLITGALLADAAAIALADPARAQGVQWDDVALQLAIEYTEGYPYLRPVDVMAAAKVVPAMHRWIGKANRESDSVPILVFREALQSLGLLQKRKGVLRLTRAGRRAQQDPETLFSHLADRLVPSADGFDAEATLLSLAFAVSSAGVELEVDVIAAALTELGWRTGDGLPVEGYDLYRIAAIELLRNVGGQPADPLVGWRVSPAAAQLAHAALQRS